MKTKTKITKSAKKKERAKEAAALASGRDKKLSKSPEDLKSFFDMKFNLQGWSGVWGGR